MVSKHKKKQRQNIIFIHVIFISIILFSLQYVEYNIQILAYTRLGDGSLSFPPVRAQTFEDTPGKPSNVSFPDVTYTMGNLEFYKKL
jgi:hypothetical protein